MQMAGPTAFILVCIEHEMEKGNQNNHIVSKGKEKTVNINWNSMPYHHALGYHFAANILKLFHFFSLILQFCLEPEQFSFTNITSQ
jgi:hypothetical protein